MKAPLLLFLLAAAATTPATCDNILYDKQYWCNHGCDGNGDCETQPNRWTFCCIYAYESHGEYVVAKWPVVPTKNYAGETGCGAKVGDPPAFEGKRYCGP